MADDNFLVDLPRSLKIAEQLIRKGATFKWSVQATTNLTARLSVEELSLLRRWGSTRFAKASKLPPQP